ncbi:MAG: anti-sigma factor antagonist [Armatimonadota bacterium]
MLALANCIVTVQPGQPPLVTLTGEVNYESTDSIKEAIEGLLHDGLTRIAMDCSSVDFIDSSGIGTIIRWAQKLRAAGGELVLRSATQQTVHALQISGFADLLNIEHVYDSPRPERKPCVSGLWQQVKFSIPLPADKNGLIRQRVTELAESMPFSRYQIDDIRLAVGEAVSNAIRHGCNGGESDRLSVNCTGDEEKLVIRVRYPGDKFDPDAVPIPDPCNPREGGMGIYFMRASMDSVDYTFDETGTTVTMTKYIGARIKNNGN